MAKNIVEIINNVGGNKKSFKIPVKNGTTIEAIGHFIHVAAILREYPKIKLGIKMSFKFNDKKMTPEELADKLMKLDGKGSKKDKLSKKTKVKSGKSKKKSKKDKKDKKKLSDELSGLRYTDEGRVIIPPRHPSASFAKLVNNKKAKKDALKKKAKRKAAKKKKK